MSALSSIALRATAGAALGLLAWAGAWPHAGFAQSPTPAGLQLGFVEQLYQEGDRFRAESELLRFVHDHPDDPWRGSAELARAKLYYQEGRYRESSLMLHSVLDRYPRDAATLPATRLLLLSEVRTGNFDGAETALRRLRAPDRMTESLAPLRSPVPDAVDPGTAVAWTTVLPGSGFFLLDQPAKAVTALSLNVAFVAGTVIAYQQKNFGAALILALVEIALYGGQREAVRQEAESMLAQRDRERREAWARSRGERELLAVGIQFEFGGK